MTDDEIDTATTGEARERRSTRRKWLAMVLPGFGAVVVFALARLAMGGSIRTESGLIKPGFAILWAIVLPTATILGAIWHHKAIDEIEERAILWANTAGFYAAIVTAMIAEMLVMAGFIPRISFVALLIPAFGVALSAYIWVGSRRA